MVGGEHDDLLSLSEAARRSGLSRGRLRRLLDGGDLPGARRAPGGGPWQIPASDLTTVDLAAVDVTGVDVTTVDLTDGTAPGPGGTDEPDLPGDPADAGPVVDWLRAEVERWRRRAEVAEAQARERQTHIVDLQRALAAREAAAAAPAAARRPADPAPVAPDRILAVPAPLPVGLRRPRGPAWLRRAP